MVNSFILLRCKTKHQLIQYILHCVHPRRRNPDAIDTQRLHHGEVTIAEEAMHN